MLMMKLLNGFKEIIRSQDQEIKQLKLRLSAGVNVSTRWFGDR